MESNQEFHPTRSKYLVITADYLAPLLIVLACVAVWWGAFYTNLFAIKHIDCELDFEPCTSPNLLAEIDKYRGNNVLRLNEDNVVKRLTSADFTIRQVHLTKVLPDRLILSLESVYPVVAAQVKGRTNWVTFDDQLRVIGTRDQDPNVPVVIVSELRNIVVGEKINHEEINTALSLARSIAAELSGVKTIELSGNTLMLALADGPQVLMTTTKSLPQQIKALQALKADATILSGISVVDVRFTQPVLR